MAKRLISDLKESGNSALIKAAFEVASSERNPFRGYFFGRALPKTISDLQNVRDSAYLVSWSAEAFWTVQGILAYAREINLFIKKRSEFENQCLMGRWADADETINQIQTDICISLWSLENRFLVLEYNEGFKANKAFLSKINAENKQNLIPVLADFLSCRAEQKMSVTRYSQKTKPLIEGSLEEGGAYDYACFHAIPSVSYRYTYSHLLYFEARSSIIDRYLTLVRVLQLAALEQPSSHKFVTLLASELSTTIADPQLQQLLAHLTPSTDRLRQIADREFADLLDLYTVGSYRDSAERAQSLIFNGRLHQDIFEIAAKSLARISAHSIRVSNNFASEILKHLTNLFRKDEAFDASLSSLLKITNSLGNSAFSIGIASLIVRETFRSERDHWEKMSRLNSAVLNPRLIRDISDTALQNTVIASLESIFPNNLTVEFWKELSNFPIEELKLAADVPTNRKELYKAQRLQDLDKYTEAASIYRLFELKLNSEMESFDDLDVLAFLEGGIAVYIATNDYLRAARLVARWYLKKPKFFEHYSLEGLVNKIEDANSDEVWKDLAVPIVYNIRFKDEREVHIAYDNFLSANGCQTVSEWISNENPPTTGELIEFLDNVCRQDVMSNSVFLNGTNILENERIAICNILRQRDPNNDSKYLDEISRIVQASQIRLAMQQIEERKIYVDVEGIKRAYRSEFKESFDRMKEFSLLSEQQKYEFYDTDALVKSIKEAREASPGTTTIVVIGEPKFHLFVNLFRDIRDRFVSSNEYGLDSYLSVRIRHGTLLGQLRSAFEKDQLLTQKDAGSETYSENVHWTQRLEGVWPSNLAKIQDWLASLSGKVDAESKKLKEQLIRISTEKSKTDGLFTYEYNDLVLQKLYSLKFKAIIDFDSFLDAVINELWERTLLNLEKIRNVILSRVKPELLDAIIEVGDNVRNLHLDNSGVADLVRILANCRTNFQNEIESLSGWFTISNSRRMSSFKLIQAIHTAEAIVNRANPNSNFHPQIVCESEFDINGAKFEPLVDVILILFDNINKHSLLEASQVKPTVTCCEIGDRIILETENSVNATVDLNRAIASIKERIEAPEKFTEGDRVRREGGSGVLKLRKLLHFDLNCQQMILDCTSAGVDRLRVYISVSKTELMS